jgi:hypothetical protein
MLLGLIRLDTGRMSETIGPARYGRVMVRVLGALAAGPLTLLAAYFGADHFGPAGAVVYGLAMAASVGLVLGLLHPRPVRVAANVAYGLSAAAIAVFITLALVGIAYALIPHTGC